MVTTVCVSSDVESYKGCKTSPASPAQTKFAEQFQRVGMRGMGKIDPPHIPRVPRIARGHSFSTHQEATSFLSRSSRQMR